MDNLFKNRADKNEIETADEEYVNDADDEKETAAEENSINTHVLKKGFEVNGEMITKIEYDLTSVKPIQYLNLIAKLSKKNQISVPELDTNVQIGYFSLACGIPVSDLKRIPNTQDFTVICSEVRNFLLGTSDMENEEE